MQIIHHDRRSEQLRPSPRSQSALVGCQHRSCIYLIGGYKEDTDPSQDKNCIYEYNFLSKQWSMLYNTKMFDGETNGYMSDVDCTFYSCWGVRGVYMSQIDSIFVFGGCSDDDFIVYDTLYQFVVHEKTWYKIENKDIWPSNRYCFGMVQLNEFEFSIIGGAVPQLLYLDVWKFDIRSNTWTQLTDLPGSIISAFIMEDNGIPEEKYASRKNHACSYDAINNRIYLFGGLDNIDEVCNDLLYFDLNDKQWHTVEVKGTKPNARFAHTMTLIKYYGSDMNEKYRLVVVGGRNMVKRFSDISEFNIQKGTWKIRDNIIEELGGHCMFLISNDFSNKNAFMVNDGITGNRIGVFGGRIQDGSFSNKLFEIVNTEEKEFPFISPLSKHLFENRENADVIIISDGRHIKCHSIIINRSGYFSNILQEQCLESNQVPTLKVDIEISALEALISFLYGYNISPFYLMSTELNFPAIYLSGIAKKLGLDMLDKYVQYILYNNLSVINVFEILEKAKQYQDGEDIIRLCIHFLRKFSFAVDITKLDDIVKQRLNDNNQELEELYLNISQFTPQIEFNAHFKNVYLYDKNTDVKISLEIDQSIVHTAHKLVIASQCDFFRTMLESGFSESKHSVLLLTEIYSHKVLVLILEFLYTQSLNETDLSITTLMEVFESAHYMSLQTLEYYCLRKLRKLIKEDNAKQIYDYCSELQTLDLSISLMKSLNKIIDRCSSIIQRMDG